MAELSGAEIIAKSLKTQDVNEMFGVVGVPVGPIAAAAQKEDIRYVGVRHEQAAAYAAQAVSYINGRIAAALVVSGPGMTNAITALGNAEANCWPMICWVAHRTWRWRTAATFRSLHRWRPRARS